MAEGDIIIKGRDVTIRTTLKDSTGAVIPLDSVQGYVLNLYYPRGHVLERYSQNVLADHSTVIEIDIPGGVFDVLLQASKTDNAQVGELLAEAFIQSTDTNFEGQFKQTGVRDKFVATIVESSANELVDIS